MAAIKSKEDSLGTLSPLLDKPTPPPTRYPHYLATVCRRWKTVLDQLPRIWAKPIVFLNADIQETLADLNMSLILSKDVPLAIIVDHVLGMDGRGNAAYYRQEYANTRRVFNLLKPHLHRCKSIDFHTIRGLSLPSPSQDLSLISSTLRSLSLRCEEDDEHLADVILGPKLQETQDTVRMPLELENLCLSGYTIMDACRNAPYLFRSISGALMLSNYETKEDEDDAELVPLFLKALCLSQRGFGHLEITGIRLHSEPVSLNAFGGLGTSRVRASRITLKNLWSNTMSNLFDHLSFPIAESMDIRDYFLPRAMSRAVKTIRRLCFDHIASNDDLLHALEEWNGDRLVIKNCNCNLGNVLVLLAERRKAETCQVSEVFLYNCSDFSLKSLRALCDLFPAIQEIRVVGAKPPIYEQDEGWLHRELHMICWDGRFDGRRE
ncbi:hypothetical protein NLJ89_g2204 [Agrocybe chaxingu]|uniref:Uncharacterized protein n=1 Tax=Agrocybe chaxingu TaxID=84603 RepID=A0A9W8MXU1_9AGAR|nr:hypothetical protein NLJ89_g2204 [Agrocybe chaxingu]